MDTLETRIAEYLGRQMPDAGPVQIHDLARIPGGSSQETFRFRAQWTRSGEPAEKRLILRRAPEAGLVKAERDLEFTVYSALAGQGLPVPAAHYLELDPVWLDRPFFIMDMMPGSPGNFSDADPYGGKDAVVADGFWRHLGRLAKQDHTALGLSSLRGGEAGGHFWQRELDHWEAILDEGERFVEPLLRGAIRWMRRNPPHEAQKPAIVHGDYRSGNFLFLPDGSISALLDWEMCHVGDPLEDIAWAVNPMWTMERHMPLEQSLAIWEEASGLVVDRQALDWWRLFAAIKACGIWTTAEASFEDGTSREMIVALTAIRATHFHRGEVLDRMARYGAMG